jgi:hypothetical protein
MDDEVGRRLYALAFLLFTGSGAVDGYTMYMRARIKLQAIVDHPETLTDQIDAIARQMKPADPVQDQDR